jgi:uncharacterized repeat protein (TIGR01451 family)
VTLSVTAPAGGAIVTGTTRVTATTAGSVASVQFKLDGSNLGAPVTAAPFTILWNTAQTTIGAHNLVAVATDNNGRLIASAPVSVNVQDFLMTIAKSHGGNFVQGQSGAPYTLTVSNTGNGSTNGPVTVVDTVPAGLTATAIGGPGWTCPTLTSCNRSDVLNAGSSYPAITLTVDVAGNAPALVINSATVSGGGDTSATNTATDPTTIIQLADLTIAKTHTGNFGQGEFGATYTITVSNVGPGATIGPVTVSDTLPDGLIASAISGSGWTCPTLTSCNRSDVLAPGDSYPAITLTVNVAVNAPASVTNTATVSGGGELNLTNDSATDPTTIDPLRPGALSFVSVTPCRIADTRLANGPFGGPFLSGQSTRGFTIPNGACNVPVGAQAYSLNVTVVPHGPLGFLTTFPCGQAKPLVSTLNSIDGRVKAVAAIVPAGSNGDACFFVTNDTDLVLDINGYFVPATDASALAFYPLPPCRLVDTRNPSGPLGGPFLAGNAPSRTFPVRGQCNLPTTAKAYSLNYTSVPHGTLGFLTTWPAGETKPLVSTLNAITGAVTANAAIVPAGANGDVAVFVTNDSDLVIDVNGYFAPPAPGGLALFNLPPCRVLDTRNPAGTPPFTGSINVNVAASGCGAPASAQSYVLNATVVPPGLLGFLTLWPQGGTQPTVSTLNAIDGAITSNLALVPSSNGSVSAFASSSSHLVLDISGYFAAATNAPAAPAARSVEPSFRDGVSVTPEPLASPIPVNAIGPSAFIPPQAAAVSGAPASARPAVIAPQSTAVGAEGLEHAFRKWHRFVE